jgi:hypothetical protein
VQLHWTLVTDSLHITRLLIQSVFGRYPSFFIFFIYIFYIFIYILIYVSKHASTYTTLSNIPIDTCVMVPLSAVALDASYGLTTYNQTTNTISVRHPFSFSFSFLLIFNLCFVPTSPGRKLWAYRVQPD